MNSEFETWVKEEVEKTELQIKEQMKIDLQEGKKSSTHEQRVTTNNDQKSENKGFSITDDQGANWTLRKIRQLKMKQAENTKLANGQIKKIEEEIQLIKNWEKTENKGLQNSIDFFENQLQGYAFRLRDKNPNFKTHKLPFGEMQFRKPPRKWVFDDVKLMKSVKRAGLLNAISTTEKVNKTELKKMLLETNGRAVVKDTGELIDGISIEETREIFKVKVEV